MSWNRKDFGIESIFREIVSVLDKQIGLKPVRFAKSEEDWSDFSDEDPICFSVTEHISAFSHSGIVFMHCDLCTELFTEKGGIADVVKIPMCQND